MFWLANEVIGGMQLPPSIQAFCAIPVCMTTAAMKNVVMPTKRCEGRYAAAQRRREGESSFGSAKDKKPRT